MNLEHGCPKKSSAIEFSWFSLFTSFFFGGYGRFDLMFWKEVEGYEEMENHWFPSPLPSKTSNRWGWRRLQCRWWRSHRWWRPASLIRRSRKELKGPKKLGTIGSTPFFLREHQTDKAEDDCRVDDMWTTSLINDFEWGIEMSEETEGHRSFSPLPSKRSRRDLAMMAAGAG